MEIFYINSQNQRLRLDEWPLVLQEPEKLFSHKWSYKSSGGEKNGSKIEKFYKNTAEKSAKVSVFADSKEEYTEAMARFLSICEYDIEQNTAGKLYINDYYLRCYLYAADYSEYDENFYAVEKSVNLISPYPFWINEKTYVFHKITESEQNRTGLDHPFDYPYDFAGTSHDGLVENAGFLSSNFQFKIYGSCENPAVSVGRHTYKVNTVLEAGEYLLIDSLTKKIFKVKRNGEKINEFHLRDSMFDVFQKIPPEDCTITWSGLFGFDLTIFSERSEPSWI